MPELPEVELARQQLRRWFRGRAVVRTEVLRGAHTFRDTRPADIAAITGRLVRAERRGKTLLLGFSSGAGALAHLGMTGKFVRAASDATVPYSKARFVLDSGAVVHFRDPRMLGRLVAVPADRLDHHPAVLALGRDPLVDGLTPAQLRAALGSTTLAVKVALMDQGRLAGLGNIHAAEALFRARIHPARPTASLSPAEWGALTRGIHATLRLALEKGEGLEEVAYVEEPGAPNPFLVYGRAGTPCRRCGAVVKKLTQGGRTTHFCARCQPRTPSRRR